MVREGFGFTNTHRSRATQANRNERAKGIGINASMRRWWSLPCKIFIIQVQPPIYIAVQPIIVVQPSKSCAQLMKSNVYQARKRYAIVFKHPTYKSKAKINYAPMYIHIIKSLTKVPNDIHIVDKPKVMKRLT
jgi:hypothetical protein